jgi:hypothetical protein
MENKRTKKALDDEALDQVTGGTSGDIPYITTNVSKAKDKTKADMILGGYCPYFGQPNVMEHGGPLEQVSDTEYNCIYCGIKWILTE